jgi:Ca-activated chloride channel family protein
MSFHCGENIMELRLRRKLELARKRGGMRAIVPLLILVACGISLAQQPIRVRTNLVNVAFTARNPQGALVDTLTENDIGLFEDGVQQKIAYLRQSVDAPLTLGLIVDGSGSQGKVAKEHQRDLAIFLKDVLGPKDRAFLVYFGNRLRLLSDYSHSSEELMARYETYTKTAPKEPLSIFMSKGSKKNKKNADEPNIPELGPAEERVEGTAYFDAIYFSVAEKLAQETGRRALIVFSDGEDNSSEYDMMSAIEAAQSADVPIFTIRYTEDKKGHLTPRNKFGVRVMERVAKETGGADFDARKLNPHEYFRRIGEELRSMYEAGYYSTNSDKDQTFRKVLVRPTAEGIKIRSKPGYYAR